jgi:site-specific recombinase XerD
MNSNVYLVLDTRRKKNDKTYPVAFRINHKGNTSHINSGYSVAANDWNTDKNIIKPSCKVYKSIAKVNIKLKEKEMAYLLMIEDLRERGILETLTMSELKERLVVAKLRGRITLFSYADEIIDSCLIENRVRTASSYRETKQFITNYHGTDIKFIHITPTFLSKIEKRYMSSGKNHYNGLSVHLRNIRSLFNKAISDGLISSEIYPFKRTSSEKNKYQIKHEKTKKRAISKEFIQRIEAFAPDAHNKSMTDARNLFLFSFYMRGMNMVDMAYLTKSNIQDGNIVYTRRKTGRKYEIKLNDKARTILQHYNLNGKMKNDLLLPIIKRQGDKIDEVKDISNKTKIVNVYMKKIAKKLDLKINLTSYVSRHSWATIADKTGIDRRTISQGLGHSDLRTTDIYIDDIVSGDDLAAADDLIIN